MKPVTNVVLYAVAHGADAQSPDGRKPLASYSPLDKFLSAKIGAKVGDAMRAAELSGVPCPDFKIVRETRSADEGGRFVTHAEFVELDANGREGDTFQSLADLFANRDPVPVVVESEEQKAERVARAKSDALSV